MTPTRRTIAKCDTFQGGRQSEAMQGDPTAAQRRTFGSDRGRGTAEERSDDAGGFPPKTHARPLPTDPPQADPRPDW
jgi:hypothetical protein